MKKIVLPAMLAASLLAAAPRPALSQDEGSQSYLRSVMTILVTHIQALRHLTEADISYSDNVVRHAVAVRHTIGLLGHMEWSAETRAKVVNSGDGQGIDAETFRTLAKAGREASRNLVGAAKQWLEDNDREKFLTALDDMGRACNGCHTLLRPGAAPILVTAQAEQVQP